MGKTKKCIIAICIAVLLVGVGAGTIIYRQVQGSESLWGIFAKDHKDLVKKYPDWFNKDGEFYFKIAEKKKTGEWDKMSQEEQTGKETQIPEELIKAMTTEQLLDACARHPLAFRYYADQEHAYLDWDTTVKKEFNGMAFLLKRNDLWDVCYQLYANTDIPQSKTEKKDAGEIEIYKQLISGGMLYSTKGYKQLTKKQREMVVCKTHEKDNQIKKQKEYILYENAFDVFLWCVNTESTWQKVVNEYDKAND